MLNCINISFAASSKNNRISNDTILTDHDVAERQNQMIVGTDVSNSGALPQINGANTGTQLKKPTPQEITSHRPMLKALAGIEVLPLALAEDGAKIDSIQSLEETEYNNSEKWKPRRSSAIISQPNITQPNNNLRFNVSTPDAASEPPNGTITKGISNPGIRKLFDSKIYNDSQLYKPHNKQSPAQLSQFVKTKKGRSSKVVPANPKIILDPKTLFPLTDDPNKVKSTSLRTNSNPIEAAEAVELVSTVTPELIQSINFLGTSNCNQAKQNGKNTMSAASTAITTTATPELVLSINLLGTSNCNQANQNCKNAISVVTAPASHNAISVAVKLPSVAKKAISKAKNRISNEKPFELKKLPSAGRKKIAVSKLKPFKKEPKPKRLKSYEMKLSYPIDKENCYNSDKYISEPNTKYSVTSAAAVKRVINKNPLQSTPKDSIKTNVNGEIKLAKKRSASPMPNTGKTTNKKSKFTLAEPIQQDAPDVLAPGSYNERIYISSLPISLLFYRLYRNSTNPFITTRTPSSRRFR